MVSVRKIGVALVAIGWAVRAVQAADPIEVSIAYVGDESQSAYLGAAQGLEEANVQGRFLGQVYQLAKRDAKDLIEHGPGAASAILVAGDADTLKSLSRAFPDVPVFNLELDDDALRQLCLPNVLHIVPSSKMKHDAEAQWLKQNPESKAKAVAWHSSFEKYSGVQLNNRFTKRYARPMDDAAWAGWAAVKMLSDTIARVQASEPAKLLDFMKHKLEFDGQKGIMMGFRASGQLRQVILLVDGDRVVGEAPVRGVVDIEDLDSLGAGHECE